MREYDKPQIKATVEYVQKNNFPLEKTVLEGKQYNYFILPQALNPGLPDFAWRMTKHDEASGRDIGVFGVCESVPAELRPYWVQHEIIEFFKRGIGQKNRCRAAEQQVLATIPEDIRNEYIARRKIFFTNLISYFAEQIGQGSQDFSQEDVLEAQAALDELEGI